MTKSGLVYPTHFVRVLVEARWLRNGKLGTRHITVVSDDLLEPYGKDLLAGKKIIDQLRVMSGMVLNSAGNVRDSGPRGLSQPRTCPSLARLSAYWRGVDDDTGQSPGTSDYLPSAHETPSQFTPSNSGLMSLTSTNNALPQSTALTCFSDSTYSRSAVDGGTSHPWEKIQDEGAQERLNSVEGEPFETDLNRSQSLGEVYEKGPRMALSSRSYMATHGSSITQEGSIDTHSPTISHCGSGRLMSFDTIQDSDFGDGQSTPFGHLGQSQPPRFYEDPEATMSSTVQSSFISEDSSSAFQGIVAWDFLPANSQSQTQTTSQSNLVQVTSTVPQIRLDPSYGESEDNDLPSNYFFDMGGFLSS
ncbi:hypothetical protein CGMCC3_g7896 [Colletotrichum fructicola]|nr:uncharacterized protein CGMCC3_g7896 [Colletotrichum fructicola]KAE9576309.1 hypothetical protein CGMCC3_g7896 [Colletotrichum fructicola]KAF5509110.1 hypothetical protein CGCF413_v002363 [Colletotrichum fructicola]